MVTPAAHREAVAHLRSVYEMSERRACRVAAQVGLLPTPPITAQITQGLSLWLDKKRGSRQRP